MKIKENHSRKWITFLAAGILALPVVYAQDLPDGFEISPFGGVSIFRSVKDGLGDNHVTGGAFGARVTENIWNHFGLEESYTYSVNNVEFLTPAVAGAPNYGFGSRLHTFMLNPLLYFTPKGSRVRPYATVGGGAIQYTPTGDAKALARSSNLSAQFGASNLNDNLQAAMSYGGGVKVHLSEHFGVRLDVRGLLSRNPTYSLPNYPTGGVYIQNNSLLHGFQATAGLTFYFGHPKAAAAPPAPAAPAPPPAPPAGPISSGTITGTEGKLCQGRAITLHSTASDPVGHQLKYAWKVNGQEQSSETADLQLTPDHPGSYTIEVTASDPATNRTGTPATTTINVAEYKEPTATACTATPAELNVGDKAQLSMTGAGSDCSTINYKWTVTEGTVTGETSANAEFDSSSVQFQPGAQAQTKTVTATGTVTDDQGKSASCTATLTVKSSPKAQRFADIVYAKDSARVNNCGKRVLLEELAPKAADPDYDVVLVGHIDQDEATPARGRRRAHELDRERVMNAAAVLSAGKGICAKIDPSRIKIDWVGTDQTADFQPGLCGTSARPASKERKGQGTTEADEKRRVEVWLVPKGAPMPSSVKAAKSLPEHEVRALGCPR
ncbi:MAG TPA: outer membrane beta-barrel protein [Bryobacteraceae bacterium]|nr:outer membrane beta-barrel protein [Bryobacteraceae bacterium]